MVRVSLVAGRQAEKRKKKIKRGGKRGRRGKRGRKRWKSKSVKIDLRGSEEDRGESKGKRVVSISLNFLGV